MFSLKIRNKTPSLQEFPKIMPAFGEFIKPGSAGILACSALPNCLPQRKSRSANVSRQGCLRSQVGSISIQGLTRVYWQPSVETLAVTVASVLSWEGGFPSVTS